MFELNPEAVSLCEDVIQHLIDHPEEHDQGCFMTHCGTRGCIAGHLSARGGTMIRGYLRVTANSDTGLRALGINLANDMPDSEWIAACDLREKVFYNVGDNEQALIDFKHWVDTYRPKGD